MKFQGVFPRETLSQVFARDLYFARCLLKGQGSLNDLFGGDQTMQMYGNFLGDFPCNSACILWVFEGLQTLGQSRKRPAKRRIVYLGIVDFN